jgi:hypothetical protein
MPASATALTRAPRTTLNGFAPGIQIVAKMRPRSRPVARVQGPMRPTVRPQSTPCRFRFTLSQTRTISATRAEVHRNLSRRPSPHGTATRRWPVKCRRGHRDVQTRGARAADHGIRSERRARLRALSRSVGTADGVPSHGSASVVCQLCCQSVRGLATVSAPAAHCPVSATSAIPPGAACRQTHTTGAAKSAARCLSSGAQPSYANCGVWQSN